ncbi:MAG: hypothetical protein G3M78_03835 [Candidatus Nitrohelix vancouverensis]|uniref:Cytochrome c-552/4 domain-containing protein n=1 Tax=Candidatus Nitrohelix vancouverensis TaxID=2705534 RepID=A0A7T0C123_9BACT|nr:MAG: hypothetical protein G3M78_03835 [Candidatus Nitrohelix vancouverensis]
MKFRLQMSLIVCLSLLVSASAFAQNKVIGPKQCSDSNCHKSIFDDLLFHPHETFFNEKFEEEGVKIAEKMNVKDQFEDEKCIKCHGIEVASDYPKVTEEEKGLFGIVCETCHNPAQDWVEIHDKKGKVPEAIKAGMRDTRNFYAWSKDCFRCHRGAKEDFYKAGHRLGEKFDLVKYSQGDFKHWVWSKEQEASGNLDAKLTQKIGKIWVAGEALQVEASIMRISEASGKGEYTEKNAALLSKAVENLKKVAGVIPSDKLSKLIAVGGKVNADPASAKAVAKEINATTVAFVNELDAADIAADKFASFPIPDKSTYIRNKK